VNVNDPIFTDLALKVIAGRASEAERSELAERVAGHPELETELESLRADVAFAKEVLPLLGDEQVKAGELPGYARARLRAAVKRSLGNPARGRTTSGTSEEGVFRRWWWLLGLATAGAVGLTVLLLNRPHLTENSASEVAVKPLLQQTQNTESVLEIAGGKPSAASNPSEAHGNLSAQEVQSIGKIGFPGGPETPHGSNEPPIVAFPNDDAAKRSKQPFVPAAMNSSPVIQLAMLDSVGQTRGTAVWELTTGSAAKAPQGNLQVAAMLKETLHETNLMFFSDTAELKRWVGEWPSENEQPVFKIWYDRDTDEVGVSGLLGGKAQVNRKFAITTEQDLPSVLKAVSAFIRQQQSK
jgi:hypothetical protein